jgi:hypothetical protein
MDERQAKLAEKIIQPACFVIGIVGMLALLWHFVRVRP